MVLVAEIDVAASHPYPQEHEGTGQNSGRFADHIGGILCSLRDRAFAQRAENDMIVPKLKQVLKEEEEAFDARYPHLSLPRKWPLRTVI